MSEYSAVLGSDCPFFIYNKPMIGSGRGTDLLPADISLADNYIRIIHPGIHISTAQAFANLTPADNRLPVAELLALDKSLWKDKLTNDFCKGAYKNFSQLSEIESSLYNDGAFYACMSGSGSAVYGLFDSEPPPAPKSGYFIWTGRLA
jgi:4-diphosphocytidyl-2-C-methyl-D-erythritol kinase